VITFASTTFLSAFLLFLVQPLIARQILPWFGGSSSVWSVCMLFFQVELLVGYAYVHLIAERLGSRRQALVHGVLLLASLATLPITADPAWKEFAATRPGLGVCLVLALAVGVPYLMLSTTGPLMQAWFARVAGAGGAAQRTWRLYALSNLGSMLALVAYPLAVEPVFELRSQALLWSLCYAVFVGLGLLVAWRVRQAAEAVPAAALAPTGQASVARPGWRECLLWVGLAATPSVLLLSLTRQLTTDVAPVPFLWVLPLALYLLSFILCFDAPRYYVRPLFLAALPLALGAVTFAIDQAESVIVQVVLIALALFVFCMVCHGELTRRKPAVRHLTLFYLMMSIGGALGGTVVGLLAPVLFDAYYELPLGLALCATLVMVVLWRELRLPVRAVLGIVLLAYVGWLGHEAVDANRGYRLAMRNFYSQTRVEDRLDASPGPKRVMVHGTIVHGEQLLDPAQAQTPTAYYCTASGIGRAMASLPGDRSRHIGVVGLGAGTLAAYGRAGDRLRIYEINDQVLAAARSEFSFLSGTPATVTPVLGDARLMLERELARSGSQQFDLLAMDAFSGDSIPVHLVTMEAMQAYMKHLTPEGILAVHITNHYLDLRPVMAAAARQLDRDVLVFDLQPGDALPLCRHSVWALLVPRTMRAAALPEALQGGQWLDPKPGFKPWTDSFSNLLGVLQ
jgi:hypothetical protein